MGETTAQVQLLLLAPQELPELRLFRRNIGQARLKGGYVVEFAIAGQSDIYAITRGGGHIEIELKSADAPKKLRPDQEVWATWCRDMSVPHLVLRAAEGETSKETARRWCVEIRSLLNGLGTWRR